jgi:hypothetical protein
MGLSGLTSLLVLTGLTGLVMLQAAISMGVLA